MKSGIKYLIVFLIGAGLGAGSIILFQYYSTPSTALNKKTSDLSPDLAVYQDYLLSALDTFYKRMPPAKPGEWLSTQIEKGQTFAEYIKLPPIKKTNERNKIYFQPLGNFTKEEKSILITTADYIHQFYDLPVEILDSVSIDLIPDTCKRINMEYHQLYTPYILDKVLKPRIPADAVAYVAFTRSDLYPNPDWNFVFGQASLVNRVGVYSIARFGNPAESKESYKLCLSRTLKVASHEIGHMFSIRHCIAYQCNMNGSNNLIEMDRRPHHFCPVDMFKLCWNMEVDEILRCKKLRDFWKQNDFPENEKFYTGCIEALKVNNPND